jgi:hypothetical protein
VLEEEEKPSTLMDEEQEPESKEMEIEEPTVRHTEPKPVSTSPKVEGCKHHFGYLSQRSSKEKIPEECITCENIVQCMLKNVTG